MILNLRGTSGSGKSTVVRGILCRLRGVPCERDERGKVMAYRCGKNLFIIGRYETACGGCDTLRDMDTVDRLVRRYARRGHVLFEGLIVTSVIRRWLKIAKASRRYGQFIFCPLDTSLEQCYANVLKRNGGKPVSRANLEQKWKVSRRCAERAIEEGCRVRWIQYGSARRMQDQVLRLLRV